MGLQAGLEGGFTRVSGAWEGLEGGFKVKRASRRLGGGFRRASEGFKGASETFEEGLSKV